MCPWSSACGTVLAREEGMSGIVGVWQRYGYPAGLDRIQAAIDAMIGWTDRRDQS